MHLSVHSSSFPAPFPSLEHMRSSAVSPDASGSVSPGERRVIHYLKIPVVSRRPTSCSSWLRIPYGFGPVGPSELPCSLYISVPQSAEWHSWSQRSFGCRAGFIHCNLFHGWFILINTTVCFISSTNTLLAIRRPLELHFHFLRFHTVRQAVFFGLLRASQWFSHFFFRQLTPLYFASPKQCLDSQPTDGIWQHSEANKFKAFFYPLWFSCLFKFNQTDAFHFNLM